jgi:murein DD-endopeptidase MepM/ murein hydrolase activator NlpD
MPIGDPENQFDFSKLQKATDGNNWEFTAGWRTKVYFLESYFNGIHPSLDWNFGDGDDDLGLPIYAIADGTVIYSQSSFDTVGFGNMICIAHQFIHNGEKVFVASRYSHMQNAPTLKKDDKVDCGEIIGRIGNTGSSTHPHLDFSIFKPKALRVPGTKLTLLAGLRVLETYQQNTGRHIIIKMKPLQNNTLRIIFLNPVFF